MSVLGDGGLDRWFVQDGLELAGLIGHVVVVGVPGEEAFIALTSIAIIAGDAVSAPLPQVGQEVGVRDLIVRGTVKRPTHLR